MPALLHCWGSPSAQSSVGYGLPCQLAEFHISNDVKRVIWSQRPSNTLQELASHPKYLIYESWNNYWFSAFCWHSYIKTLISAKLFRCTHRRRGPVWKRWN